MSTIHGYSVKPEYEVKPVVSANKLDTILHNIYADHTEGCDPNDCWSTVIVEAYIAERETALTKDLMNKAISFTANNDAGYFINSGLADVFDKKLDELELKSNERS